MLLFIIIMIKPIDIIGSERMEKTLKSLSPSVNPALPSPPLNHVSAMMNT